MPDLRLVIAHAIRAERARAGITQDQLAKRIGWSRSVVTMIEKGDRVIGAHELPAICRALDAPLARILHDADPADLDALGL